MRSGTPAFCALATFEPGFSPTMTPVVFFETLSETLAPSDLERGLRLVAREALERARDHVLAARQRPLDRPLLLADLEAEPELAQLGDERAVLLVREPLGDRLGPVGPDPLDLLDLLLARAEQAVDGAEVPREVPRRHPADVRDVEPEEDARERLFLRLLRSPRRRSGPRSRRSRRAPSAAPG